VLLTLAILFFAVSMFSSKKEVYLNNYLDKAAKWNDENIGEKLSNIKIGARIMPSFNTEGNLLYMNWVSMTTEIESSDAAASQDYFYNKSLHLYNDTRDYFPTLNLNPEFVPFGDSKQLCVNIAWAPLSKWRVSSMYREVNELPQCTDALNPKVRW
jgi:hypothetical protein